VAGIEVEPRSTPKIGLGTKTKSQMYLNGMINGHKISFLIDTGASISCISSAVFERVKTDTDKLSLVEGGLDNVSGGSVSITGIASLDLQFGQSLFPHDMLVAQVSEAAILGMDFFAVYGSGLDFGGKIVLNGVEF
jgi:hypothetical protein